MQILFEELSWGLGDDNYRISGNNSKITTVIIMIIILLSMIVLTIGITMISNNIINVRGMM